MVASRQASAFVMDDILLSTMIAEADNPERYALSEEAVAPVEPLGFMMRREDDAFAELVNNALKQIYTRPDMPVLYQRWFQQPLPGKGITLNISMSAELTEHFKSIREGLE